MSGRVEDCGRDCSALGSHITGSRAFVNHSFDLRLPLEARYGSKLFFYQGWQLGKHISLKVQVPK